MEDLPSELDIIVLDDLTDQLDFASSVDADEFITDCRNLADNGKTVILTTQSHSPEGEKRDPTEEASDLRMELELIKIVGTEGTLLKLLKSSTVEIREDSQIAFKVAKKVGACSVRVPAFVFRAFCSLPNTALIGLRPPRPRRRNSSRLSQKILTPSLWPRNLVSN